MFDVTVLPANMRGKIMVSISPNETNGTVCWEWAGATNSSGYGSVTNGHGGTHLTHRASYELLIGKIANGLTIDHLCLNKLCVNTDHMELVTRGENSRRKNLKQSHCRQGHPLSGANLRVVSRRTGHLHRVCVTCQRQWSRACSRKRRALVKQEAVSS